MNNHYFTIVALTGGNVEITLPANITTELVGGVSYSVNGEDWIDIVNTNSAVTETISGISKGDRIYLKGEGTSFAASSATSSNVDNDCVRIKPSFNFNLEGNIMSLLFGSNFQDKFTLSADYTFALFFYNNKNLISVKDLVLPAKALTERCYYMMFSDCSNLEEGVKQLPARIVPKEAYRKMFASTKVKHGVKIDCDIVEYRGCYSMYYNSLLETMPTIRVGTAKENALMYIVGATKLKESPKVFINLVEGKWGGGYLFHSCAELEVANDITIGEIRGEEGCMKKVVQECFKVVINW